MHYSKQKFEDFIVNSRTILNISTRTSGIKEAVGNFGYTEERLAEGQRLYDELVEIAKLQEQKEEEKKVCFDRKAAFQAKVSADYMKYLKIARIVFNKDDEAFLSLALKGQRERTYDKWYHQVSVFCNNLLANPEYIAKMKMFGVKKSNIEDLRDELYALQRYMEECTRISATVRRLVKDKKYRMIKWQEWLSNYIKIVRIALQGVSVENKKRLNQLLSHGE
ncbi:MAG: hypothetical protein GXO47_04680 [Chlorobi bacterium]|nr:hypothetical protein [Chlorobiota bacterium]